MDPRIPGTPPPLGGVRYKPKNTVFLNPKTLCFLPQKHSVFYPKTQCFLPPKRSVFYLSLPENITLPSLQKTYENTDVYQGINSKTSRKFKNIMILARRRRGKLHFRSITKRISIIICPPQAEIFWHFGRVFVSKMRSWVQSGSIFCIKHPPKSSKISACGGLHCGNVDRTNCLNVNASLKACL